ncbi:hypothetical protein L218DRAFT_376798 [Marasmius fiardii PR-910]|nr:hypothetical protein L218DRAFT_376798 [Marasmius fiardii PR-910]
MCSKWVELQQNMRRRNSNKETKSLLLAVANTVDASRVLDTVEFINFAKTDAFVWPSVAHRTYPCITLAMRSAVISRAISIPPTLLTRTIDDASTTFSRLHSLLTDFLEPFPYLISILCRGIPSSAPLPDLTLAFIYFPSTPLLQRRSWLSSIMSQLRLSTFSSSRLAHVC